MSYGLRSTSALVRKDAWGGLGQMRQRVPDADLEAIFGLK